MVASAALVVQHGPRWTNKIACAAWDNQNVVRAMETRRSRNRYVRYLLAIITRCEIEHKFMLLVFYINTHHNHPADDISREFGKWLPLGYDAAVAKMQEYLTQHFPQYAHFRHEPMQKLLGHLAAENHALRSFALPAEAADPNSLAYQLGQARLAPSPWSGAAKMTQQRPRVGAGVVAVVELRAGLGQLAAAMESLGARVHGLMEPDPVARRVLQRRFPRARRSGRVWNASEWRSVAGGHLIVLGTIASAATTREIAAGLAKLARLAAPSVVLVAAIGSDEWDVSESILAEAAGLCGCRLRSRAKLTAAEWGARHSQEVELFEFAAEGRAAEGPVERGWAPGPLVSQGGAPTCPRQALRAVDQVPAASRLAARVTALWAQPGSRFAPATRWATRRWAASRRICSQGRCCAWRTLWRPATHGGGSTKSATGSWR